MASKSLFLFVTVLVTTLAQDIVRLNSTTVPRHYEVQLTLNVQDKVFSVEDSISLTVLEDTEEIVINSNGLTSVSWLTSSRIISEDGLEYKPIDVEEDKENDLLVLRFEEVISGDANYTLHFTDVQGSFGNGLVEVPLSTNDSSSFYLLSTGFNTTNLRDVFPCFDQPEFRTTFSFTVYHPDGYTLVTNSEEVTRDGPIATMNHFIRSTFEIKRGLPTHSIGLILTNLPVQSSPDNRVRVYHPNPSSARILLTAYHSLLLAVEEELQQPMEIPKLDIVYTPTLPTKSLSKWGLVAVAGDMSPVENSVVHSVALKDVQKEIARSVYQMFFGQLITPEWWTSQWVTLGLARYLSGVTKHLPFDAESEFLVDTVRMVVREHDLYVRERLSSPYPTKNAINNPNLFVMDQRASAIMRMISHIMGKGQFHAAVLSFLANNRNSVITSQQFIAHLELFAEDILLPEDQTLSEVVYSFEQASASGEYVRVDINQRTQRFTIEKIYGEFLNIPVDYMTPTKPPASRPQHWALWQGETEHEVDLEDWILVNPELYGLYPVYYTEPLWTDWATRLREDLEIVPSFIRAQLISDSVSFPDTYWLRIHLNLIRYLSNETDAFAWRAAGLGYDRIAMFLRSYEDVQPFYDYYNSLSSDLYSKNRIGHDMEDLELTMEVAKIACYSGNQKCIQDVEAYYNAEVRKAEGLVGSSDFQVFVYCTLAKYSSLLWRIVDRADQFWKQDRGLHAQSRNAIKGLACSPDPDVANKFLNIALTKDWQTPSERFFLINTFLRGSHESVNESLQFILEHFVAIQDLLPDMKELFDGLRHHLVTQSMVEIIEEIRTTYADVIDSTLWNTLLVERVLGNSVYIDQNRFRDWVNSNIMTEEPDPDTGLGNALNCINWFLLIVGMVVIRVFN